MKLILIYVLIISCLSCAREEPEKEYIRGISGDLPICFTSVNKYYVISFGSPRPFSRSRQWTLSGIKFNIDDGFLDVSELFSHVELLDDDEFITCDVNYEMIYGYRKQNEEKDDVLIGMLLDTSTFSFYMSQIEILKDHGYPRSLGEVDNRGILSADHINKFNRATNAYLHEYVYIKFPQKNYVFVLNPYSDIGLKNIEAIWGDRSIAEQADTVRY